MSNYYNPVKIIKTINWLHELQSNIENLEISSPVIVTSPGNRKRLKLDSFFPSESIFCDVDSNPTFDDCINAVKFCQKNIFDGVIALGGGSVMDLAKVVIAYICLGKSDIYELIDHKGKFPHKVPSIFIPTTHGTASEVTMWGTIWNMKDKKKYSISNLDLYPNVAILDGNLALSLPLDISITTLMDALSHSFESIWNKNANPTSTAFAISAICLILNNVDSLKINLNNAKVRNNLLEAATTAGLAFSNTKTAAAHSISYPLTIYYKIPHGIASSMPLLPLLIINKEAIKNELEQILENLNYTCIDELIDNIRKIPLDILKFTLQAWGVKENEIPFLVAQSFTKDRMENNIITLSSHDVENIFFDIF